MTYICKNVRICGHFTVNDMNIAVIFAGGSGQRMNAGSCPKQFLKLNGKPIIIYTLEIFSEHREIDKIVVSCIGSRIPELEKLIKKYEIDKVAEIVPGGETGQDSICNGLAAAARIGTPDSTVLIHDGVRPLVEADVISECIASVKEYGSAITSVPSSETFIIRHEDGTLDVPPRKDSWIVRAPQCFRLGDILAAHERAKKENRHDFIDSCSMMTEYGHSLHLVKGSASNIKITTPADFYIFKTMQEIRDNYQIFGFEV